MLTALLLALALGAVPQDPVEVGATLRSTRLRVGESTVLQISVSTPGETATAITMPDLPSALEVVSTQDFSQLQISYPGGRSRLLRRDVVITPRAAGEYRIGEVKVEVERRTYSTRPLTLLVLPGRTSEPPDPTTSDVRLRAWLEPDTAFVGQQVLLHAEALFPQDLRLRQTRPASYDAPTPPDFWIQDLPESLALGLRSINGEVYETQTFRRAYFPLAAGTHDFDPARLVYEVRRGFLYAPETRELASDSLRLVVLPLPTENRPSSFTGAVGRFTVEATLQPTEVAVGDATTLTFEISGAGNIKALPAPHLPPVPAVELYPPSEDARVETVEDEIQGVKQFSWVLIPEQAGPITLPAIEYGFFDAESGSFATARTDPISLAVLPASRTFHDRDQLGLDGIATEPWLDQLGWVRSPWFAAAQLIPLLALLVVLGVKRRWQPRQPSRRQIRTERSARFDALRASAAVEADRSWFGTLAGCVRDSTAEALDRPDLRTLPAPAFHRALETAGVRPETRADLTELLARLEHARFAPEPPSTVARTALLEEAELVVDRLDRETPTTRRRGPATAAGAIVAALAVITPLAAAPADFARGVAAYQEGRFENARSAFELYVADAPRDASGWYNLGNAHFAAGNHGEAVWAWLKALRLRPRYYAARHNLAVTGADEALRWMPPPFVPTLHEAILAMAIAWWIAVGIVILATLANRKKWLIAAACVMLLGLIAAGAALPASMHTSAGITLDPATPLLAGPADRSDEIRLLTEGEPLSVLEERAGWFRVRAGDETEGWVEASRIGPI
jgi:TolA-binding protein